ncbi:uncharacterized protein cubi_02017 [Cryptosporidium ubiquitum]|uniref:Calponin-homology (CH) domain-containing protein n=1 Tax=Cryptosporidium ubiquitum TaxID=857276 RepID=A0A1J4MMT2_9CRYT|nr:uncharacterized protein cubi_02017 [Cryptosporidium ubiquitum]OII75496.1 hypothetical protein cubi_02017 [Cryptosporidium ubiquitum]
MEVFEIFIIRYINYINIWSIELTSQNFYQEFRDGILLVNLLKQWSSLYGYNNTEGDLVIYKRPLNRSQALNNINLCINFILNPPEKSQLPEYLSGENELIKAEEIYDMNEKNVIRFISTIFHHYLIPYLRVNSKIIINNMNEYLILHGLSLSNETIRNFYKMIMKKNINQIKDDELLERIESWNKYLSLNMEEINDQEKNNSNLIMLNNEKEEEKEQVYVNNFNYVKMEQINSKTNNDGKYFEPKYINSLQCDITSNGFILIMIMLYQMGWIDTAILCQMYYVPKTLEEFKWNHEIVYYSFQTINKYLNIQKEVSIVKQHSLIKQFENNFLIDESESDDETMNNITNCEIPFILVPLSSLYMENFSPYVLLLQIEILYNLLTQQIDSNYDFTSYSSNRLAVYGPYQPISLELLDELTYKDDYPLNWTMGKYENNISEDQQEGIAQEEYENEERDYDQDENILVMENYKDNQLLGVDMVKNKSFTDKNTSKISKDNLARIEALINESNMKNFNDKAFDNNKRERLANNIDGKDNDNDNDDDYVVGSMYEYLQDKEKEIDVENRVLNLYENNVEETEYDIGYNYNVNNREERNYTENTGNSNKKTNISDNNNHHHSNKKINPILEGEMDQMFTGLEKELEILKIYDENNYNENSSNNENKKSQNNNINVAKIFQEKMMSNTKEFKEKFSHILTKEGNQRIKVKPSISRTALEEQQKKILGMVDNDDDYTSKVFDITRKQSDGVMEKISTAISENNKLLEKLKMSMNVNNNNSHSENKLELFKPNENSKSIISNPKESKENNNELNNGINEIITQKFDSFQETLSNSKSPTTSESNSKDDLKDNFNVPIKRVSRKKKVNKVSFSDLVQMEVERTAVKS